MFKSRFILITILFVIFFFALIYVFHNKAQDIAISNAKSNLNELMMNYKAFRKYVSMEQKEEIYRLQDSGLLSYDYFHPEVLSSTYGSKRINHIYNLMRKKENKKPISIKFATTNPRNPKNLATPLESDILKKFNEDETLQEYTTILEKDNEKFLFYAIPTKKTTEKCMRCHSTPDIAPKQLVKRYGDKNGFGEQVGMIRATITTMYPLEDDLNTSKEIFYKVSIITFIVFVILLLVVYRFMKKGDIQREKLEELNKTLDNKVNIRTQELAKEKNYLQKILDTNPSMILITNGKQIVDANQSFLDFFGYESVDAFVVDHDCVCDYFDVLDEETFPEDKMINGVNWCKYLAQNREMIHTVSLTKDNESYYFNLNALYLTDSELLLTLQNITELKKQESILIRQSKMASMGEMLTNIAHHWRQPLSIISTSATSVVAQKEFNILTDEKLIKAMEEINSTSQFLSSTIDDFRNFFAKDKMKKEFNIEATINKLLTLIDRNYSNKDIVFLIDAIDENICTFENELIQVLINMINNARDILEERDMDPKVIKIDVYRDDEQKLVISIQDNGGGIPDSIKEKVFEPYFTTKHQYQGTGIGLYMSYEIINQHMGGEIEIANEPLTYEGKEYMGAKFKIILPI